MSATRLSKLKALKNKPSVGAVAVVACLNIVGPLTATGVSPVPALASNSAADNARLLAQGRSATTSAPEPTVEEVINNALTAYGGKTALAQVAQNATFIGEQKVSEGSAPVSYRLSLKGDKWRLDLNEASSGDDSAQAAERASHSTVAFDGRKAWQIKGKEASFLLPTTLQNFQYLVARQPFLLAHWQDRGYQFNLLGRTNYKQTPVFSVEVISPTEPGKATVFIDQQNFHVLAIISEPGDGSGATRGAKAEKTTCEYSQYRPVGGTLWPFKQIQTTEGGETAETDLKSADLATEIADSAFSAPNAGSVAHLSKELVVPFDYAQHEIVVKGRLNSTSEELEFLVDTGASDTLIDRRVAAEHFLPKDGAFNIAAMSGVVTAESSLVKRLELGKLIVNDVSVRILDLSGQSKHLGRQVAGIIGMNVISRYLVTLDYSKPSITFADADEGVRPNVKPVAFVKADAPYVSAALNGKEACTFLVDTGAAFNHLPEGFAKHYVTGDANSKHFIEGTGLDGQPVRLGTVVLDSIVLGGFAAKRISLTYPVKNDSSLAPANLAAGLKGQKGSFFQDMTSGILGNPFWQNFVVIIDSKYQRMFLKNNPGFNARDTLQKSLAAADAALTLHRDYREAEFNYQKALMVAESTNDQKERARLLGRLGNLRRLMAKDLKRPEHAKASYDYFSKAEEIAQKSKWSDVEGRILADWSLLYADNGQQQEARTTMERGLSLAADDPNVNVDIAVQLYRAGQFPEMQKYVEKALFLDPDNWQALWYQVKLSENFNDTPRVVSTLKDIVRYYPWSKVAKDKLSAILDKANQAANGQTSPNGPIINSVNKPATTPTTTAKPAIQTPSSPQQQHSPFAPSFNTGTH